MFGRATITLGIGPHSSLGYTASYSLSKKDKASGWIHGMGRVNAFDRQAVLIGFNLSLIGLYQTFSKIGFWQSQLQKQ